MALFPDRCTAGSLLRTRLTSCSGRPDTLVLALPPGGVPVAHAVATGLGLPLDLFLVCPLRAPGEPGPVIGAVTTGGVRLVDHDTVRTLGLSQFVLEAVEAEERGRLEALQRQWRGDWPDPDLRGRPLVVVDEGLATGATMHWAVTALRRLGAETVIVAAPTASRNAMELLADAANEVVVLETPDPYISTARWYESFEPVANREVVRLLESAAVAHCRAGRSFRIH